MDAAGSAGSLGIAFGLEPMAPLAEAVRIGNGGTEDDVKRILQSTTEQLSLLVCGGEPLLTDMPDADSFEGLVNRVMQKYPVVVVDLSGASAAVRKRMIARAAHNVIVTTGLLPALRNCRTLLNEIKHLRGSLKETQVVLNMQGAAAGEEISPKDIGAALEVDLAASIPYAPKLFGGAEAAGKPLGQNRAADGILKALTPIAELASGATAKDAPETKKDGGGGSFSFLKSLGKKK